MEKITPGHYRIEPNHNDTETLLIGPVTIDAPDTAVKVNDHPLIENWLLKAVGGGKLAVYSKRDRLEDYKWIADLKKNGLYVSSRSKSASEFRIEPAGDDLWRIIHGDNNAVTFVKDAKPNEPQLIFKPWVDDDSQKFKFTPIGESYVE